MQRLNPCIFWGHFVPLQFFKPPLVFATFDQPKKNSNIFFYPPGGFTSPPPPPTARRLEENAFYLFLYWVKLSQHNDGSF